jgi:hypothetical protein
LKEITIGLAGPGQFSPTDLVPLPDGSGRMAVATLGGTIRLLDSSGNPLDSADTPYIEVAVHINDRFNFGMTSLAFHPDFAVTGAPGFGKVYCLVTEPSETAVADFPSPQGGGNHQDVLVEWSTADPASDAPEFIRRDVMRFDQPFANHNAVVDLAFDSNAFLYLGSGDGGALAFAMNSQDLKRWVQLSQ